jgi:hypothetical protein
LGNERRKKNANIRRNHSPFYRYHSNEFFRTRWDILQSEYKCCGGHEGGYREYANATGAVSEVPDSCCIEVKPGCGEVSEQE